MSFLDILKKVREGVHTGVVIADGCHGVVEAIPGLGNILSAIKLADEIIPAAGKGPDKKIVATALINSAQPGMDPAQLSTSIDSLVAALKLIESAQQKK